MELVRSIGAHIVLDHTQPGYLDTLAALTDGVGPDVILEMLADKNLENDMRMIAKHGRIVVIGSRGSLEMTPRLLMAIGADAAARRLAGPATFAPASRAAELAGRASEDLLRSDPDLAASGMTPVELTNGLVVWTMLVGAVSAEVFQQLGERTISDAEAFFDYQVATAAAILFGHGG